MHAQTTLAPRFSSISSLCLCILYVSLWHSESLASDEPKPNSQGTAPTSTPTTAPATVPTSAPANTSENIATEQTRTSLSPPSTGGLTLFMGVEAGPIFVLSPSPDESNKNGYLVAGKGLASLYWENWVLDTGIGWLSAQVKSQLPGKDEYPKLTPGTESTFIPGPVKIIVNSGFAELAARYRLSRDWQLGIVGDVLLSSGDTSFGAITARDEKPTKATGLIGGQIAFGTQTRDSNWRFCIEYLTDLTIKERQVHFASASLQFGIPIIEPDRIREEREVLTQKQRVERVTKEKLEKKVVVRNVLRFVFDSKEVLFVDGGKKLHPDSLAFIKDIGALAAEKNSDWAEIEIDPQLMPTVPADKMALLREFRANAVRAALRLGGADNLKIKTRPLPVAAIGKAPSGTSAITSERLVLNFKGMQADRTFIDKIRELMKQYRIPDTCVLEQGCK
jgi:hypothetical protein